jgi:alpha-glucoside transport system permease protein
MVVLVTLMINVLKIFDLVLVIAPGSVQDEATVLALQMWREAVQVGNRGTGSAMAIFLLILVIPAMLFNLRRFRLEEG